jgi:hypothetical protein
LILGIHTMSIWFWVLKTGCDITPDPHLFHCAHFHMLQQMSIVSEYFDEHKEVLLRDSHARNES